MTKKGVLALWFAVTAIVSTSVGYVLGRNSKKKKKEEKKDGNKGDNNNSDLDKLFVDDLTFEIPSQIENKKSQNNQPAPVVVELEDRSWWSINKRTVFTSIGIVMFSSIVAFLSFLGHCSYQNRQKSEILAKDSIIIAAENRIEIEKNINKIFQQTVNSKLDSIDVHIRALQLQKFVKETQTNQKTKKKEK